MSDSPQHDKVGTLIMAANSLGNPSDVPQRTIEVLQSADLLIFEEDKGARQALKAAKIHREYLKLSEHEEKDTLEVAKRELLRGKTVVYVSDQGTPTLADPGRLLLEIAYQWKSQVQVIPGPCSISATLSACPFPIDSYLFRGFLSREEPIRCKELEALKHLSFPVVILDAPYRKQSLFDSLQKVFGPDRLCFLGQDISGPSEAFILGKIQDLMPTNSEKLNFVLIISPDQNLPPQVLPAKKPRSDRREHASHKASKSGPQQQKQLRSEQRVKHPKRPTKFRNSKPKQ